MRFFNIIYLILLAYIIAALVFWGLSLNKQSKIIYEQQLLHLRSMTDSSAHPVYFDAEKRELEKNRERRLSQYIGEGGTFMLVILIGAAVVYSSVLRSNHLSRQQNNFMLAVTHELKSPIAAIKLNLQTLQRHHLDEEKKELLTERCIKEANRLNDLCSNMLLASQMEGRQYKPIRETLDINALIGSIIKEYTSRYPQRSFSFNKTSELKLLGDTLMLQMAFTNIIENAIKYSPAEKPITVSLKKKGNNAILQIADEGIGISDSEKQKIFRKFYRIGNENTRKTKGTGLGLYLAQKIIHQHDGKIVVRENQPNGAVFEISLPLS
ncbi:MAG: GHKL domain-containing protein [Bacteroidetes bacterium]|nr:GHKL domain-containing protein [Bacteroidota bacterium]MBS1741160.1 GHKL domain-containing protein [Bacteroidota bacterium]